MSDSPEIHRAATWILIALALVTFVLVSRVTAPYGRHQSERADWGPTMSARLGWIVMESPAVLVFAWIYLQGQQRFEAVPLILLGLWQFHYVQRTLVFPFRMRNQGKRMPVLICASAFVFQVLNSYVNARWISQWGGYDPSWLADPRLWVGGGVFLAGWVINFKADSMLFALRKPGEGGYQIPRGWLYEYVSCPNYLGEILIWCGWAIATWSLAGLAFALYTVANVGPRALAHHRWYRREFQDYPAQRKALIPFVV
jgi:protein-S-isoprenylcysteine O-methyltransferase Ste14